MGLPRATERIAIIDEFGELSRKLALLKPDIDRHKQLKDTIAGWYDDADPASPYTAEGKAYNAQVGAKAKQRRVTDQEKMIAVVGQKQFNTYGRLALEVIDRLVPTKQQEAFLATDYTGARSVKTVARAAITAPKKKAA